MEPHYSSVYKYFGLYKEEKVKNEKGVEQSHCLYKCLICTRLGKKDKDGEVKIIRSVKGVTSNLIRHLECTNHESEYAEYQKSKIENKKRPLCETQNSPCGSPYKFPFAQNSTFNGKFTGSPDQSQKHNNLLSMGAITKCTKYARNSFTHQERYKFTFKVYFMFILIKI